MDSKGIFEALQAKFGEDVVFGYEPPKLATLDDYFFVKPERLTDVAKHLRDDPKLAFDYLECLSGVDYPDAAVTAPEADANNEQDEKGSIHVVYHLRSYDKKHRAVVKVSLPRKEPRVATLTSVWSSANWQERECWDLLGVHFEGHPDLRRIMLPDDWEGFPLRKDYVEKPEFHGIPTTRPNPFDLLVINKKPAKKPAAKKAPPKKDAKATDKKPAKEPADADPKTDKKPAKEPADADPKTDKKPAKEPADADPKTDKKPAKEPADADPKTDKKPAKDEPADADPKTDKKPAKEPADADPKTDKKPAKDEPADADPKTDKKPAKDEPADADPKTDKKPAKDEPADADPKTDKKD